MKIGSRILQGRSSFESADHARRFVEICENEFEARLDVIADTVAQSNDVRIVALSGPSCSGKTTTANKLIRELEGRGKRVHVVSIDDFFYDISVLHEMAEETGKLDYDSVKTIDLDALAECVEEIFADGKTHVPRFDFTEGKRVGYVEYSALGDDIFIFEGIQAIYPEVLSLLSKYKTISVCICVMSAIEIDGVVFEPHEIRFLRRVVRDYHFRSSEPEFTMELWEGVRCNEDQNIIPYIESVDMQIDSTLVFELSMLRPYLEDILGKLPAESKYYPRCVEILQKIKNIQAIPKDYISENSLYNEFI